MRSIKTWLQFSEEELDWPAQNCELNPIGHLLEESEHWLRVRLSLPTSVPDLTHVLLVEWAQIPTDTLQDLNASLCRGEITVTAAKRGPTPY